MMKGLIVLAALVIPFQSPGCQTRTTRISETEAKLASGVCSVWLPVHYKSTDSNELEVRQNNAARTAYCEGAGK